MREIGTRYVLGVLACLTIAPAAGAASNVLFIAIDDLNEWRYIVSADGSEELCDRATDPDDTESC